MNIEDLLKTIPTTESNFCNECHKETLKGWTNSNSLERKLSKISVIEPQQNFGYETYAAGEENPFSSEATVALSYYPYNGSTAYQCGSCNGVILIYLETGGHAARYQARWVRSTLAFRP